MSESDAKEIVITGLGVVSPIGSGIEPFWEALLQKKTGVTLTDSYLLEDAKKIETLPFPLCAPVVDLDIKRIKPRKNVKVMARDIQLGFVAADFAHEDSQLAEKPVDPTRQGIVFGTLMIIVNVSEMAPLYKDAIDENQEFMPSKFGSAIGEMFPLWMLKYLPNMTPCHIGIAFDLQGPSNTLVCGETGGINAITEACRAIHRGYTDVMYAGGCASCCNPSARTRFSLYQLSSQVENPAAASRPFDAKRDGVVLGEAAGTCILETRESALRRDVPIYATICGHAETAEAVWNPALDGAPQKEDVRIDRAKFTGKSIRNAIQLAMQRAGITAGDLAFVMACGNGTVHGDAVEAAAIHDTLGDVPVTAIKGATGHAMAGSSSIETVATVLALSKGIIPPTVNCDEVASDCPIQIVKEPREIPAGKDYALVLSYNFYGQAAVLVLKKG